MRERGEAGLDGWIRWVRETGGGKAGVTGEWFELERRGQGWMKWGVG